MTDPATLLALADRCEQATGPDWLFNAEIAFTQGYNLVQLYPERRQWWRRPDGRRVSYSAHGDNPPPYTASLDAAVTLVPDGWGYEMRRGYSGARRALCRMWDGSGIWIDGTVAATPALALCAAALRARAAMAQPSSIA
jgi:hypothetical protein